MKRRNFISAAIAAVLSPLGLLKQKANITGIPSFSFEGKSEVVLRQYQGGLKYVGVDPIVTSFKELDVEAIKRNTQQYGEQSAETFKRLIGKKNDS